LSTKQEDFAWFCPRLCQSAIEKRGKIAIEGSIVEIDDEK